MRKQYSKVFSDYKTTDARRVLMNRPAFSAKDLEFCLQRKSWWAMLFILPAARRLSLFFINRTSITPNTITLGSFVFVIAAVLAYSRGSYAGFVIGAIFFEINYLFDCVDGTVARAKGLASPLGAFLDPSLDRLRIFLLVTSLAYGQYTSSRNIEVVFLIFLYLGLNNLLLFTRQAQERATLQIGMKGKTPGADLARNTTRSTLLARWLNFTSRHNTIPYYHDVELDALVFVVGPILNMVVPFIIAANLLALVLIIMLNIVFVISINRNKGKI